MLRGIIGVIDAYGKENNMETTLPYEIDNDYTRAKNGEVWYEDYSYNTPEATNEDQSP